MAKKSEYLDNFKNLYDDNIQRSRRLIVNTDWYEKKNRLQFEHKIKEFKVATDYTSLILQYLQEFIEECSTVEREMPGVQVYINSIVEIINIHLKRIDNYYKNTKTNFKSLDHRREEDEFQTKIIFEGQRKIKKALNKLNIKNDYNDLTVKFYDDAKASLLLREPLVSRGDRVAKRIEAMNIDWNPVQSTEMLINMKQSDIPPYDPELHFWEQPDSTVQFWQEERMKLQTGININGYHVHPWLYWHLNIFKTPIPLADGTEPTIHPYFRDNEYFFVESVKEAEALKDRGLLLWGTRRFSKSVIIGSYIDFKAHTKYNSVATVTGGSEGDLSDLTDKIKSSMDFRHPALRMDTLSANWNSGDTKLGIRLTNTKVIDYSIIRVKNLAGGASKSTQKTAGGGPSAFVTDEIGKFNFLKSYLAALPSFRTPHGFKALPILVGTAGESDLSNDAFTVLSNPEMYKMMPMNWDLLEHGIDPDYITWTRRMFGTFAPGQMSYLYPKIDTTFDKFMLEPGKDGWKDIKIQKTNWKLAKEEILKEREEAASDKLLLQQITVQTPIDPEDSMMSAKKNPFPATGIKRYKQRLQSEGDKVYGIGRRIELYRNKDDHKKIEYELSTKEVNEFPHNGKFTDCPFVLYDDFPETRPLDPYRYLAGLDDYKQDQSEGDSIGSFYIFDRLKRKIVLSLANRPDPHTDFHKQMHMALDAYNAKCFMENEDMDFKKYLDRVTEPTNYLYTGFDAYGDFQKFNNGTRKFGWKPDKNTVPQMRGYVIDYVKDNMDIFDNDGNITHTISGYNRIDDIQLLEEMINFKSDGNFDRIVAFGSCLAYDFYLTNALYITPQTNTQRKEEDRQKQFRPQTTNRYLTKKRYNLF